jgi:hypothetical protein
VDAIAAFPATDHASRLARAIALDDDDDDDAARDADVDPRAVRASIARARAKDVPADVDARDAHTDTVAAFARVTALETPRKTPHVISDAVVSSLSRARSFARRFLTSSARRRLTTTTI